MSEDAMTNARRRFDAVLPRLNRVLLAWLPLAVGVTLLAGLVYVTAQQVLRMNANDPQVQMAEDAASALVAGQQLAAVVPQTQVDIGRSLAPFIVVYDDAGGTLGGSGLFGGRLPELPPGVFDYARHNGSDRITWQPAANVRHAIVVVHYAGPRPGFVMAGRSLRESEYRSDQVLQIAVVAWAATLVATLLVAVGSDYLFGRRG
jgi:hypothetical protein